MKTIEERILELEKHVKNPAGTQLVRTFAPEKGIHWTLGIGQMGRPLCFFYGNTIEDVVSQAEKVLEEEKEFKPYTIEDALNGKSSKKKKGKL